MSYLFNSIVLLASRRILTQKLKNVAINFHGHWNNQIIVLRKLSTKNSPMCSAKTYFIGKEDRYNGIIVDSEKETCDIKYFYKKLEDSLKLWTENGKRAIWFKVHLCQSDWVPVLAKKGFKYHHAKEEYVMMYFWLPKTENSNLPHYAHTMLGVGAVVTNDNNEILIVQEKYSRSVPHYKLPGGYVEPGENIVDAAIREVHEETNIHTEFQSVLTLRHTHQGIAFNCSDIYLVVHLKALSNEIIKCEREIAESKWINIKEYLNHPQITMLNKFFVRKYLEYKKHGIKINCSHAIHELFNKPYTMYSVTMADMENDEKTLENAKSKNS